jgi:hypothetical protein
MATIINNVVFAYVKMKAPVKALNEKNTEVSVQVVMSEDDADNLLEACPSANVKSYKNDVFEDKFKFEAPFEGKKQFVASFKKMVSRDGVDLPEDFRPRVIHAQEDGSKEDITFTTEIGNGSKGAVAYSTYTADYKDKETNKQVKKLLCQLVAIQVEELIEYNSSSGDGDGASVDKPADVFGGSVKLAQAPKNQAPVVKQSEATPVKKPKAAPATDFSDMDYDIPFMRGCKLGLQDQFRGNYAHYI